MNDNDYVNFSEQYELDYILRKFNKKQSLTNRVYLVALGNDYKNSTGKSRLQHEEFHSYVRENAAELE